MALLLSYQHKVSRLDSFSWEHLNLVQISNFCFLLFLLHQMIHLDPHRNFALSHQSCFFPNKCPCFLMFNQGGVTVLFEMSQMS